MKHYLVAIYIDATPVHKILPGHTALTYRKEFRLELPEGEELHNRIEALSSMVMDADRTKLIQGGGQKTVLVKELQYNETTKMFEEKG